MKRNNRSKSDRLDDILDENIINGDMSENELDDPDNLSDDEIPEDDPDNLSDDEISDDDLDDIWNESLLSGESENAGSDDKEAERNLSSKRKIDNLDEKSNAGILLGIAWILFAILCALYIYVFFIKEPQEIPGKNNTVKLDIPDGANYRLCDIDEINQLVVNFLTARANCDQHVLQSLVTDPSQFDDMSGLEMIFTDYAEGYQDSTCYIIDGYAENEYIVIELSYLKLVDIKSQPLDVMSFYIIRMEDGTYRIDNSVLSTEVETYISNATATQDIQDIYIHVKEQNDYLLQTDTAFADLYHRIME